MVAHSWGIVRRNWARAWAILRKQAKLNAEDDDTLMPACGPDWKLVKGTRMTSDALIIIVRDILQEGGLNSDEAQRSTAHTLKTTFLSWCGKAGVAKEFRLTLGCHSKGKECMADLYSRDELAEPARQLGFVMAWVIENRFLPDSTRSGAWQTPAHENTSAPRSEPRAGQYLGALCKDTNQ